MNYKSDAQRAWAHTEDGMDALGGKKEVSKLDKKSKGKDLPKFAKKKKKTSLDRLRSLDDRITELSAK